MLWHQGTLLNYGAVYAAGVIGRPVPETVPEAAECAIELLTRDNRPVPLLTTPLVHATAVHQANTWFSVGGMVTLLPRGPVDGAVVCATIERERVTLLSLVGDVILRRIVGALEAAEARGEPYDLSSLRRVHNSGAMVNAALKDALLRRGTMSFYDSLGSSEAVGFGLALTTAPGEHSTARFVLGPRARVVTEDGVTSCPARASKACSPCPNPARSGTTRTPSGRRRPSARSTAPRTRCPATGRSCTTTRRSRSSAVGPAASTPAARRCGPKRSKRC